MLDIPPSIRGPVAAAGRAGAERDFLTQLILKRQSGKLWQRAGHAAGWLERKTRVDEYAEDAPACLWNFNARAKICPFFFARCISGSVYGCAAAKARQP